MDPSIAGGYGAASVGSRKTTIPHHRVFKESS